MGTEADIERMFSESQDEAEQAEAADEFVGSDEHPPMWGSIVKLARLRNGDLRFYVETLGELKGKQRLRNKFKYDIPKGVESRTLMAFLEKYYKTYSVRVVG